MSAMSELYIELTDRGVTPETVTGDDLTAAAEAVGATGLRSDIPRIADYIATRRTVAQRAPRMMSARQAEHRGYRPVTRSVEWVAQFAPNDGDTVTIYRGFGHVQGSERFQTERIRRNGNRLEVFTPDGHTVVAYPLGQGRTIRTLVAATEVAA